MPFDAFELQGHDETGDFSNSFLEYLQMASNDDYETKKKAKSKAKTPLEDFLGNDNE
jgi:hypothetical protein